MIKAKLKITHKTNFSSGVAHGVLCSRFSPNFNIL